MTETYYSSDWHLGHARIIELCGRPFANVAEMNQEIIARCNRTVGRKDRLVLCGDNVMGKYSETVELLRQIECENVTILPGNHDRFSLAYRNSPARRLQAAEELRGMGFTVYDDTEPSGWVMRLSDDTEVAISHYPYAGDSGDSDRHGHLRPVDRGLPLVHGHVHTKWKERGRMLNVGVDRWDFTPVSEDEVLAWVATLDQT